MASRSHVKLTKLQSFTKGCRLILRAEPKASFYAQHDIVYIGSLESTEQYAEQLVSLGFHKDEDAECWGFFT